MEKVISLNEHKKAKTFKQSKKERVQASVDRINKIMEELKGKYK